MRNSKVLDELRELLLKQCFKINYYGQNSKRKWKAYKQLNTKTYMFVYPIYYIDSEPRYENIKFGVKSKYNAVWYCLKFENDDSAYSKIEIINTFMNNIRIANFS